MKVEEINAGELLEECLAAEAESAGRHGMTLEMQVEDPYASVRGDRRLLLAAVNNLIDNALRHGRPGGKITAAYRGDDDRGSIVVRGDGSGIPYDELRFIRDMFCRAALRGLADCEQVEDDLIGLTIVRDVANLHSGRVGVRSIEGEGSTFSFHLPRLIA